MIFFEQQLIRLDFGGDPDHNADTGRNFYHCGIWAIVRILRQPP